MIQPIYDLLILFGLGVLGWLLIYLMKIPAAGIIGPIIVIGTLNTMSIDLPSPPKYLFILVQIILGVFVGSKLDYYKLKELRPMALGGIVVVIWSLAMSFMLGLLLTNYTILDLYTAILAVSMGGLPEMTIVAISAEANVSIVVFMHLVRVLGTVLIFPFVLNYFKKKNNKYKNQIYHGTKNYNSDFGNLSQTKSFYLAFLERMQSIRITLGETNLFNINLTIHKLKGPGKEITITITIALLGGWVFNYIGVPAGFLVGSTIIVGVASIIGVSIYKLPRGFLDVFLIFIGINIADNITPQTIIMITDKAFLYPILIASIVMFGSSFIISNFIHRLTGWDYPTSFLAAAPSGFSVMAALSSKYDCDSFKVSMMHLCRLLTINILIPFVFMYIMKAGS